MFAQQNKINVQFQWKNQYEFAGFFIAKEKGYYDEIGLDVDFVEFNPKINVVEDVLTGKKQFGVWSSSLISEYLNGKDIVLLANYFKRSPLALITKPEIKIPADLKNKTVMIHKYDAASANYQQMFKMFDLDFDNMNVIDPDFSKQDFEGIDAISIFLTNETYNFINNSVSYNILDPSNYGVEFGDEYLFTSKEFALQNPVLVKKFTEATTKGWKYAVENIDETIDIILEKYNTQNKTKEALLFEAKESQKFLLSKYYELGKIYPEKIEKIAKLYIELGIANKNLNLNSFIFPNNLNNQSLTIDEIEFVKNNPEIIIANDKTYAPLDYYDGKENGYSMDLIKEILIPYGFKLKFITHKNWDESVDEFFKDNVNVLTSIFKSKKYEQESITSNPYLKAQDIILTRQGIDIKNANDLIGKTIALPSSYTYIDILKDNGIEFTHLKVNDMNEAIKAVVDGRADATIESDIVINYIIDKNGYINLKKVFDLFDDKSAKYQDFIFAVNKDKPILAQLINKGLENLSIEKRRELYNKWLKNSTVNNIERISLSSEEKKFILEHKKIKVSNETDYPPFDFTIDGTPSGFSIDILNLVSKKTGLDFQFINGHKWSELVDLYKEKEISVLHTLSVTDDREKIGNFSQPYVWYKNHFIIRNDSAEITDVKQLDGKIIAVGKGWAIEKYLYENHPNVKLLVLDSLKAIMDAVSNGQADIAVIDDLTAKYYLKKNGYFNLKISSWFKEFNEGKISSYHFLVQKEMPILNKILDKAIKSITLEELETLEKKWFGNGYLNEVELYLTSNEKEYLSKKQNIKLCIDPSWMPLEALVDGKHTGISAEIFDLIKQKSDLNFELVKTKTWNESLDKIRNRQCDILPLAMQTPKRLEYLDFTTTYLSFPFVIATLNSEIYIEDINNVIDKDIALIKGYAFTELLKNKYPNKKFIEVNNVEEGLSLINSKKAYAFVDNLASIAYTIQKNNYINIKVSGKFDEKWNLSVATRNDEPQLKVIMQKAINLISEEEKQKALNKWFYVKFQQSIDYSLVWKIVLLALFIVLFSLYWNRKLYKEKNKTKKALEDLKDLQKELEYKNYELKRISITDKLTGVFNRHKIDEVLNYELLRAKRTEIYFGLMILDVDYFKAVNDEFGHNVGDRLLIDISSLIKSSIRQTDILGRWGGEEFLIIVPDTNKDDLIFLAEKIRGILDNTKFYKIGKKTASFGLTISRTDDTSKTIIERADNGLYLAKHKGRNRIEFI